MKTQLPSKYPWKSSREPLGLREPHVENHCSKVRIAAIGYLVNERFAAPENNLRSTCNVKCDGAYPLSQERASNFKPHQESS